MGRGWKRLCGDARDAFKWEMMVISSVHAAEGDAWRIIDGSISIPEVLFLITAQYLPLVINEIGNIVQLSHFIFMYFHYCPRHKANFELFCQLLISLQINVPLLTKGNELRVFRQPIREMVFGKYGEVGTFGSGDSYEIGGSREVVRGVEGLRGVYQLMCVWRLGWFEEDRGP